MIDRFAMIFFRIKVCSLITEIMNHFIVSGITSKRDRLFVVLHVADSYITIDKLDCILLLSSE